MRKICVVTGSRAEYGLLYWLMREIQKDLELKLQIVVTGMHLSPEFGLTYKQIEADGFIIDKKVEMLLSSDSAIGITKSMGLGLISFADAFNDLDPDIVVLLGDRYEVLVAAQAAMVARIPLAHIHGGEITRGAIDEVIRHALTKFAHFHFVAASDYKHRVIQLGEEPSRVFEVGALGLDNIIRENLLERSELEEALSFKLGDMCFLVTYHPETLSAVGPEETMKALLAAVESFPEAHAIFTKANSDTNSRIINAMLDDFVGLKRDKYMVATSLGQQKYLSTVKHVDVVIGNSSSGILEAPFLGTPTVNIGRRQEGRLKARSVIDSSEGLENIKSAINQALSPTFRAILSDIEPIYGCGGASERIKAILKSVNLDQVLYKNFYDIPFSI